MSTATTQTTNRTQNRHFDVVGCMPVATRVDRLKAALIDGACMLAALLPFSMILFFLGVWQFYLVGMVLSAGASAAIFLLLNYNLLKSDGQTIGKRVMNIRIIGRDDQPLDVDEILLKRYLPIWLLSFVPVIGPLVCLGNVLCIFRDSHACAHDDVAGSKVVPV